MKKKSIVIILFLLKSIISLAQSGDNCFNMMKLNLDQTIDSNTLKKIPKRDQEFYDRSINCKAPDFKVVTIDGDTLELSKLKGKVVVLNFEFMECGGCIAQIPDINKLVADYQDKDVIFISMSRNSKAELVKGFIAKHTLNSIIIPDCEEIASKYCVVGWPATFILSKKGKLVKAFIGNGRIDANDKTFFYDRMKNIINEVL